MTSSPSAICTVNSIPLATSGTTGFNANPGDTITIALANSSGVNTWSVLCTASDGVNDNSVPSVINATAVIDFVNYSATFVMPQYFTDGVGNEFGAAMQFTSVVNAGQWNANTFTLGIWVVLSGQGRLFFTSENLESDATYGVSHDLNELHTVAGLIGLTGDVDATGPGVATAEVVGIKNISVPTPSGSNTVLTYNSGAFSWASVSGGGGGPSNIMWVALNGNDSTGDGSFTKPFLTPGAAETAITGGGSPASSTNPWVIQMGPGGFGALTLSPWIRVAGWPSSKNKSLVTTVTSISLTSSVWSSGQATGVSDIRVATFPSGNITLNFSSASATLANIDFTRCDWTGTATCTGTVSNSSIVSFTDCSFDLDLGVFNNVTAVNMTIQQQNSQLGVISLTANSTAQGAWFGCGGSAGAFGNGVEVITSGGSAFFNVQLLGVDLGVGALDLIGTNISYNSTQEGIPSAIGFGGGAALSNITLWTFANSIGYSASNTGNWSGTNPTSVTDALDRIAAKIGPIP